MLKLKGTVDKAKAMGPLRHAIVVTYVAGVLSDPQLFLDGMALHLRQLARCSVAVTVLLPALWDSFAVSAATPARRLHPNGPRSRVTRSIPYTGHAREAIEPLSVAVRGNCLNVPTSDPRTVGFLSCPLQPTCSGIVVGGGMASFATANRFTGSRPNPPRAPPLVGRYSLI